MAPTIDATTVGLSSVRLGFTATTARPAVDRLVTAFERARPNCTLALQEVVLADSYTPLRTGETDVLVRWLVLDEPGLTRGPAIASYDRVPLGLVRRTANENARICALAEVVATELAPPRTTPPRATTREQR